MNLWYEVDLDGFAFYARHVQSDPGEINNRTRGDTATFDLYIPEPKDLDDLTVPSGETYTVAADTIEFYDNVTVDGELIVDGILVVYGTLDATGGTVDSQDGTINNISTNPFNRLLDHDRHAGSYSLNNTLNNTQKYKNRLPNPANINSLVVGVEPATDLQNRDIAGKWGLISNVTDNRTRALTNPVVTVEVDILADYAEYSDITSVQTDLEI